MNSASLRQETYLPDAGGRVARVYDFLKAHEDAGRGHIEPRYFLAGSAAGDRVELPAEVYEVLRAVVGAMQQGLAVTVAPQTQALTSQQAADLLGVSRPTLIKMLDEGRLPFERVGAHRRILLRNVLTFLEQRRAAQYATLEATAVMSIDDEDDLKSVLRNVREARQVIAQRRRDRSGS